ncbi:hypothetical protein EJB05_18575, partial [Eragrostis curvula]
MQFLRFADNFMALNEISHAFATSGFNANLITYLTQQLHLPLVEASNTLTNFSGTSSLTPVLGALAADSFAGRFWTIIAGSVFYQVGMVGLVASALLSPLRPPPCRRASGWQLAVLYVSLLCTSLGSGGILPCVVAFGADQFEEQRREKQQGGGAAAEADVAAAAERRRRYFNLFFLTVGSAMLLALTVVVYIQENVGWGGGSGSRPSPWYPLYVKLKPGGSPFTRLVQVAAAAFKKRNAAMPEDLGMLYQDVELDKLISSNGRLRHTNQLTRHVLRPGGDRDAGDITLSGHPNLWRLSTVHRVEELKSLVRLLPIWSAGIMLAAAGSHNYTFAVMQARTLDRHVAGRLNIPPATISIFSTTSTLITLALYDRAFVPLARRVTGLQSGVTYFQRIGIGLAIAIVSLATTALVETKRRAAAAEHGLLDKPSAIVPLSVFWMVPQFAVRGVFSLVGNMEFLYDQAPESMRSSAAALFWLAASLGNYTGTVLVTAVQRATRRRADWLQDNINRGSLDNYYWLVTCIMVLNFGYYLLYFRFYTI